MTTDCKDCKPLHRFGAFFAVRLCPLHAAASDMLEVLKETHCCATVREDGTCDGRQVADVIKKAEVQQ